MTGSGEGIWIGGGDAARGESTIGLIPAEEVAGEVVVAVAGEGV